MHPRCILKRLALKPEYNLPCSIHGVSHSRGLPTRTHTVLASKSRPDPFTLVSPLLSSLRTSLLTMLASGHPAITEITKYYFLHPSKQVRPVIVLLFSQATNGLGANWSRKLWESQCPGAGGRAEELNQPLTRPDVLNDWNPQMPDDTRIFEPIFSLNPGIPHRQPVPVPVPIPPIINSENASCPSSPPPSPPQSLTNTLLPTQLRLAQIVELLHTASLLHDDVIDVSATRRSQPSANTLFGNKMAVLAGDFLLGRASVALARLRDPEVTELLATVIANLVEGEFMQLKNTALDEKEPRWSEDTIAYYLQKTYLKSASLISKSCRAAALLGNSVPEVVEAAYSYGRNLGLAFQLVDDMLDYTISGAELGKPAGADLELGLATAPLLFAWKERPELGKLVGRKFAGEGDVGMVGKHPIPLFAIFTDHISRHVI